MSRFLTLEHIREVCYAIVQERMTSFERMPPFETCDLRKMDAALGAPKRTFAGKLLYPDLESQAAVLFYEITKQHAFENGNKRMAVVSLLTFLSLNDRWLKADPWELYYLALNVAKSDTKKHKDILNEIQGFIRTHLE